MQKPVDTVNNISDTGGMDTVNMFTASLRKIDSTYKIANKTHIILPADGCPPCMDPAIVFMKKHIDETDKYNFIITEIGKLSELENKLGSQLFNNEHLKLDTGNHIGLGGFYSIYPQLISIKDHNIELYEQMDYEHLDLWRTLNNTVYRDGDDEFGIAYTIQRTDSTKLIEGTMLFKLNNKPAIGTNISAECLNEDGSQNGTVSDENGEFQLVLPKYCDEILFWNIPHKKIIVKILFEND